MTSTLYCQVAIHACVYFYMYTQPYVRNNMKLLGTNLKGKNWHRQVVRYAKQAMRELVNKLDKRHGPDSRHAAMGTIPAALLKGLNASSGRYAPHESNWCC